MYSTKLDSSSGPGNGPFSSRAGSKSISFVNSNLCVRERNLQGEGISLSLGNRIL